MSDRLPARMRASERGEADRPAVYPLPSRLDLTTAAELAEALRERQGGDLTLDAAAVTHLGTPGLQILLSARLSWEDAGFDLTVEGATPALEEQVAQFGLTAAALESGGPDIVGPPNGGGA